MAERYDAPGNVLLALYACESGAVDRDRLIGAVRAWAADPERSLSEVLASLGLMDETALSRLEDRIATQLREPSTSSDPTLTIAYLQARGDHQATSARGPAAEPARFQILRRHARGGLGEISLALDLELDRTVALKELQAARADDPGAQERFLLEANITGRLEHPGIVPIYSVGRHADGRPYYAMRLIEGETLREAIERHHRPAPAARRGDDRDREFRRLLRSLIEACYAVAYAHSRNVVHRDLKPENIMLGPFGETLVVDWGLARSSATDADRPALSDGVPAGAEPDVSMTQPGAVLGTPRYMSPEQAAGDRDRVGPASDVYSLGAILYCVLVGQPPFSGGTLTTVLDRVRRGIFPAPGKLKRNVDPALESICLRAMALDPGDRYASALDLANELEAWQTDVRYRDEQQQALNQMRGSLTRLCLEKAHAGFQREAHGEGLLWLARALENAPPDRPELERVIRTSLRGWHLAERLLERRLLLGGEVHAVALCPEGRRLATACGDRTARLWDLSTGTPLSRPLRHGGPVRALAFHQGGTVLVTASEEGRVCFWDAITGEPAGINADCGGPIHAMGFSPDGSSLAVRGAFGLVLLDAATCEPIGKPIRPQAGALAMAFSPIGDRLAIAEENGSIRFLDPRTGQTDGEPLTPGVGVSALAFDRDGRRLLTGGRDGTAQLWDLARACTITTLTHGGEVLDVGFRPEGDVVATACADGTARLWDAATGHPIGEPLAHSARVERMAFRLDGTVLATGSADGTVRLWCAFTGLPIGPPLRHEGAIRSLDFSPDGHRLAVGDAGAAAHCWAVPEPVEGSLPRIACWVRVLTELEFDAGDAIQRLDGPTSWSLRRRLAELGGAPSR